MAASVAAVRVLCCQNGIQSEPGQDQSHAGRNGMVPVPRPEEVPQPTGLVTASGCDEERNDGKAGGAEAQMGTSAWAYCPRMSHLLRDPARGAEFGHNHYVWDSPTTSSSPDSFLHDDSFLHAEETTVHNSHGTQNNDSETAGSDLQHVPYQTGEQRSLTTQRNGGAPQASVLSLGSHGHPHNCQPPCRYVKRKHGCHYGAECWSCHLCHWSRKVASQKNQPLPPGLVNGPGAQASSGNVATHGRGSQSQLPPSGSQSIFQ